MEMLVLTLKMRHKDKRDLLASTKQLCRDRNGTTHAHKEKPILGFQLTT